MSIESSSSEKDVKEKEQQQAEAEMEASEKVNEERQVVGSSNIEPLNNVEVNEMNGYLHRQGNGMILFNSHR